MLSMGPSIVPSSVVSKWISISVIHLGRGPFWGLGFAAVVEAPFASLNTSCSALQNLFFLFVKPCQ